MSGGDTLGCLRVIDLDTNDWATARSACLAVGADLANPNQDEAGAMMTAIGTMLVTG